MYANYTVLNLDGRLSPIFLPPNIENPWNQPHLAHELTMRSVMGAGMVSWNDGTDPNVQCSGRGIFLGGWGRKSYRKSHEEDDAQLFRELLNTPLGYVVIRTRDRSDIQVLLFSLDKGHSREVFRYGLGGRPVCSVLSAGYVDFGWAGSKPMECWGHADFYLNPQEEFRVWSRGDKDVNTLKRFFDRSNGPSEFSGTTWWMYKD